MTATSEKVQSVSFGPPHLPHCVAPVLASSPARPSTLSRLLKCAAIALIVGALVMLCASVGAFYQWKVSDKNVHNVHYNMRINGELREGTVEVDPPNHQETFTTGSGDQEAVEIHDFQTGISGLRFFRGEKCYIKPHIKAPLPDLGGYTERLTSDLSEETLPVRLDQDSVIWVAADLPTQDTRFLSPKILALCGDAPVYWLHPTRHRGPYCPFSLLALMTRSVAVCGGLWRPVAACGGLWRPVAACGGLWRPVAGGRLGYGERRRRDTGRPRRQAPTEEGGAPGGAAPGAGRSDAGARPGAAAVAEEERGNEVAGAVALGEEEGGPGGEEGASADGSAYNPENPYHRKPETAGGEREAMTFDPMLDHLGICCSECRRSYTHCQRVCEPLRGYWPWPYNYAGCRVACRVILPCRWWVARMLGRV
ncbi:leukocyte cell-derived chemotaxin 1-like [Gadus chalcogrammus]|uniref:leukocyte cell-derived chemotaxin 1-like n=1 Tax=Gadus chalcogrammus TaxID=1042646 RepID=UPI0024C4B784|nr:leukocyte cell-derived chemotaxin 1-like [Gadus chalcogrammus]